MKHEVHFTQAVMYSMDDAAMFDAVTGALRQFYAGDWGKVPPEDKEANDADLAAGCGRVLARYDTPRGDIYITSYPGTDAPPTVLFCKEY